MTYKVRFLDWDLRFHMHGLLVMLYFGYALNSIFFSSPTLLSLLAISGCLTLLLTVHEMAHGYMARYFGYSVNEIHYHFLGAAIFVPEQKTSNEQILVAAAGPASNFVMATVAFIFLLFLNTIGVESDSFLVDLSEMFISINLVLGVFNLVPAFPLDGGRIFKGLMSKFTNRRSANIITHKVGMGIGGLFLMFGAANFAIFLLLIGVFVIYLNHKEL